MSAEVIFWLNTHDRDWHNSQGVPIVHRPVLYDKLQHNITVTGSCITYYLPHNGFTRIELLDSKRRAIACLINSYICAGKHTTNLNCYSVGAGVYFVRLRLGNNATIQKALLIK